MGGLRASYCYRICGSGRRVVHHSEGAVSSFEGVREDRRGEKSIFSSDCYGLPRTTTYILEHQVSVKRPKCS